MRIHNIYSDEDGETHFRDIDIEMSQVGPDGTTSKRLPATGVYFRTTPADWFFDWHPATRRQYVINLDEFVLAAIAQNLRRLAKLVARPPPYAVQCIA